MSLVGTRPPTVDEWDKYELHHRARLATKPGLGKLFGGWGLYEDGQFTTESIENFMLFVPFSILLLWAFQKELLDESENIRFGKTVWKAIKVVAVFSFMIEFTQLLFHVLTYLIHLGYLGYNQERRTAFVPNEEIRQELITAVESKSWNEMLIFQQTSEEILNATLDMDTEEVAD